MSTLLPAQLAWYVTGRFYVLADGAIADYGYFLHLGGIKASLFAGTPGETNAHFTFAAQPFTPLNLQNGSLKLGLDPVGSFGVFLQEQPRSSFDDPFSFAQGRRIASFRRTSIVTGTDIEASSAPSAATLMGSNVFSAELIDSVRFRFGGREYDLAQMVGFGVTQFGTASGTPVLPPPQGYAAAIPFAGSAVALAGRSSGR